MLRPIIEVSAQKKTLSESYKQMKTEDCDKSWHGFNSHASLGPQKAIIISKLQWVIFL